MLAQAVRWAKGNVRQWEQKTEASQRVELRLRVTLPSFFSQITQTFSPLPRLRLAIMGFRLFLEVEQCCTTLVSAEFEEEAVEGSLSCKWSEGSRSDLVVMAVINSSRVSRVYYKTEKKKKTKILYENKFITKQDEKQLLFITWHSKKSEVTGNTVSISHGTIS